MNDKSGSFVRSLCFGSIAEEIVFPFPQMKQEEREILGQMREAFKGWLAQRTAEFRAWDQKGEMPASFIQEMRELGLFSLVIPEEFGGMGLSSMAYARVLGELSQYDASIALTAGAHSSIGMRGLVLFGSDEQKKRYLPKLATGELISAFCLTEPGAGSDAAAIKTKAVKDGDDWLLTGEKLWITNGGIADLFTVFARTETEEGHITAFIVTRDMPGVKHGPHEDKLGIRASSTTSVYFDQVRLSPAQVLGEVGKGFKIAMRILNSGRTGLGGGAVGAMKHAIHLVTQQANQRKQFGKAISEFGLVKQKVGQMVVDCYAAEAAVNMVASIIDAGYEEYAIEAAISKVFASEALWRTADEALQIAGGNGYMREFPYEKMLRDVRINRIFEGTNEILRLFIALSAMNDVGQNLKELAKTLGNVMVDPIKGFGVLSDYAKRRVTQATGLGRAVFTKVHPDLVSYSAAYEECVQQLSAAVDKVLRKHGKEIVNKQFATCRIADVLIDLFVMACVLSRVSTALNEKGSAAVAQELAILESFFTQAKERIRAAFRRIDNNDDEALKTIADHAFASEKFSWDML